MQLVLIEWIDAHGRDGWRALEDIQQSCRPLNCRSVGWLVAKKNGMTLLTPSLSGTDNNKIVTNGDGHMAIPNVCIKKITVLRKNG